MRAGDLDLAAFIARSLGASRLNSSVACDIAWQLARALQTLSHHRVIHRDIKPGNVFVFSRHQVFAYALAISAERGSSLPDLQHIFATRRHILLAMS